MKQPAATLLTTSGVAIRSEVPEKTIRALEKRGIIKAVRDSSGRRLFTPDVVTTIRAYRKRKAATAVA